MWVQSIRLFVCKFKNFLSLDTSLAWTYFFAVFLSEMPDWIICMRFDFSREEGGKDSIHGPGIWLLL